MKCNNMMCDNELQGKQKTFCSDKCRMQTNRQNKACEDAPGSTNSNTNIAQQPEQSNPNTNSDSQHEQLSEASKNIINDLAVAVNDDMIKDMKQPEQQLTEDELIARGCGHPDDPRTVEQMIKDHGEEHNDILADAEDRTEQPSVKSLSRQQLNSRIRAYPNDTWINSPEFNELMRRLKAWSIEKLEDLGYHVPAWKVAS